MSQATQKRFDEQAGKYDQGLGIQKRHHEWLDLAVEMSGVKDGEHVLDIGCGTGLLSLKFLEAANCTVHGIDLSENMLAIWKDKIENLNLSNRVTIKQGDIVNMELEDSSFDIVASTITLHHIIDKQPTINKIYRLLKPGGRFIIGEMDVDTSGDLNDVERLRHIMDWIKDEASLSLMDGGVDALIKMWKIGKKHILCDGEYCISLKKWAQLCENAGFKNIKIKEVDSSSWRKVLCAYK
ncbi:class I SAM-dependent methyltransferase [Chloroflexota bacterium]